MPQIFKPTFAIKWSVQILFWSSYKYKGPFALYLLLYFISQLPHYAGTFQFLILTQMIKRLFLETETLKSPGQLDQAGEEGGSASIFSLFRISGHSLDSSQGSVLNAAMQKLVNFDLCLF